MVEPKEAESIKVPLVMLASGEEPVDKVLQFEETLKVPKHVEIFKDQYVLRVPPFPATPKRHLSWTNRISDRIHGWMAARSDLSDERVKKEYIRGYKTVLEFFGKNWS